MKVTVNCNLKGKVLWRKGTVLSGPPFPSDIAEEIKAVKSGRVNTLILEEEEKEDPPVLGDVIFRKFDRPVLNRAQYAPKEIQYQATPWFHNERGARTKRQLLLKKFEWKNPN
jgi:hypothetical protein